MSDQEKKEYIESYVRITHAKKYLSCADAFLLQKNHAISLEEISRYCHEHGIKISSCQLACF